MAKPKFKVGERVQIWTDAVWNTNFNCLEFDKDRQTSYEHLIGIVGVITEIGGVRDNLYKIKYEGEVASATELRIKRYSNGFVKALRKWKELQ
jgi:hypothetical protein